MGHLLVQGEHVRRIGHFRMRPDQALLLVLPEPIAGESAGKLRRTQIRILGEPAVDPRHRTQCGGSPLRVWRKTVDAPASEAGGLRPMGVRLPPPAPRFTPERRNHRWHASTTTTSSPFEPTSKRRRGFPSEANVKRGARSVKGGDKELVDRLGNNDPCPSGSGRRFQELLPQQRPLSTAPVVPTTSGSAERHAFRGGEPPHLPP